MTQEYYTYAGTRFGKILYRGYEIKDGKKRRVHGRLNHKPTYYLETTEESDFKSIYGKPLREKKFETLPEAREFVKQYSEVMPIYGYGTNRFEYEFLARAFPDVLNVGIDDVTISTLDIETEVPEEGGFPDPSKADYPINLVTFHDRTSRSLITFGFTPSVTEHFVLCQDETDLLTKVIDWVVQNDPDIIAGWNINGFDIPYFINRSNKILGEEATNKLSPFGIIESKDEVLNGRETQVFTIVGRVILDLLEMYKKFVLTKRESYKLDHIAKVELGAGKLELPYKTFRENYTLAWDLYVKYNQIDVLRVVELEDKLGMISLALATSYLCKINYSDVYSPVKCWECYILSTLMNEKTFVSVKREHHSSNGIEGAYVAEPDPGFYSWVISIDATALYPSFIRGLNMSPETLVGVDTSCSVQGFLDGLSREDTEYAYAANGAYFSKEKEGILPRLVGNVLEGRAIAKKEMLRLKQLYVDTAEETYKRQSALQNTFQGAWKILANSLFGACANAGFIFFDPRIAEGITMSGQFAIQEVGNHCNRRFNEFFKTKDVKYNIYSDTDSIFFTLENIVKKFYSDKTDLQIVDALDKLMEGHLRKIIDEATDNIALRQNYFKKTLWFKRENISSQGFWCLHPGSKIDGCDLTLEELFDTSTNIDDENIRKIDLYIPNFNIEDKKVKPDIAEYILRKKYKGDIYTIETDCGKKIQVTENHEILVQSEVGFFWKLAKDLLETDILVLINNFETRKGLLWDQSIK